jgi:hypothetical protein
MRYRFLLACVVACAMAVTLACGSKTPTGATQAAATPTQVTTPGGTGSGTGQLRFYMRDAPLDATALLVKISEVSVHLSDGDAWRTLKFTDEHESLTCDLLQLANGAAAAEIAFSDPIPSGHYTQIRLTVDAATLYLDGTPPSTPCDWALTVTGFTKDNEYPVKVPSGTIKLNQPFTLEAGATMKITLDFDADKSVHQLGNGNWQMQPVISVVSVE